MKITIIIKVKSNENGFKQFEELATHLICAIADKMQLPKVLFNDFFSRLQGDKR